jgi:hypothetical protein
LRSLFRLLGPQPQDRSAGNLNRLGWKGNRDLVSRFKRWATTGNSVPVQFDADFITRAQALASRRRYFEAPSASALQQRSHKPWQKLAALKDEEFEGGPSVQNLRSLELLDEYSETLRDRSRESVILISQVLSDCGGKPNVSVAGAIRLSWEQRIAWDDTSANPTINSISCGDEMGHWPPLRRLRLLFRAN